MIKQSTVQLLLIAFISLVAVSPKAQAQTAALKTVEDPFISATVAITATPSTAKIFVNGVEAGSGSRQLNVPFNECLTVEIKEEGFITEVRTYCKKNGQSQPPKSDYIKLQPDDSYASSVQSDLANNEVVLNIRNGVTREEAWKMIVAAVSGKFMIMEKNDERSGYLRTSWIGVNFKANTVRTRVIVKQATGEQLSYKIKFVSEYSGKPGTAFSADEEFIAYSRILKKYEGFVEEISSRLRN